MDNLVCAKCNEKIEEANLVECPHCWEIYHKECWEETENCVTCRKNNPIYEMLQAQKEAEEQNQQGEEQELKDKSNIVDDDEVVEINHNEMHSAPVTNTASLASIVFLASGVAGGIALAVHMMFPLGNDIVGIIGGLAIAGLGVALSLAVKGLAELINNSQKNAYYLSRLVEKQKKKDE